MSKRQVFFSFDYDKDVFRVAQVKNMGTPYFPENTFHFDPQTNTLNIEENPMRKWKQDWHIKLYKLHGSINWLYDPDFQDGVRVVSSHTPLEYKQGLQCLIVPPTMLKNFELKTKLLDFQWQAFKGQLAQATKLYIIGYSIPKTDIATRYIIQTQLNPECEIFIIDHNPKADIESGWYELFSIQDKNGKLHILKNGFNGDSIKAVKLD